ncbi:uncharacterized protein LOC133845715 isoform X1 [Drosophila sulfurigaster albostrigata]|uniref:uncharacterized protein LOC133845715 isoform X1 n=1 Tax=Drosophila sulfurigaster albostrigata TaxID=89887 RepID=UPI002D21C60D|nr:uncharacterized protein LOC133845715 isoform X1 [Drosophila sulfurigaster albostrigata]
MWNVLGILLLICGVPKLNCSRFTNVECKVLDASYVNFNLCDLNVLGRGIVALNIHAVILKEPLKVAKVNLSLWRKFNGYRPFMFNTTYDFCRFMDSGRHTLSFEKIIMDAFVEQSNINHSCPYESFIVRNLVFENKLFKYMPLPTGEYKIRIMAKANNDWKAIVQVYITIKEDI